MKVFVNTTLTRLNLQAQEKIRGNANSQLLLFVTLWMMLCFVSLWLFVHLCVCALVCMYACVRAHVRFTKWYLLRLTEPEGPLPHSKELVTLVYILSQVNRVHALIHFFLVIELNFTLSAIHWAFIRWKNMKFLIFINFIMWYCFHCTVALPAGGGR
jgi:hypothetical protein